MEIGMNKKPSTIKQKQNLFAILINPGAFISGGFENVPWPFAFSVSGFSFLILFLQTGLDRLRAGTMTYTGIFQVLAKGLLLGTLGVFIVAFMAFILSKLFGGSWKMGQAVRAVALSYGSALVYMVFGLIANLIFKWNTSVAFGVTGVLWALGPLYGVFRNMAGERIIPSIVITTVCGSLVLCGWYILAAA